MSPLAPTTSSEKQRYFQSVHKPTYLKGRYDLITSVAIPLALAVSSMYLVVSSAPH
jgi:hypothetical protein